MQGGGPAEHSPQRCRCLVLGALLLWAGAAAAAPAPYISWEYDQLRPAAAYGESGGVSLVVWEDHHWGFGADWDIYGRLVGADGAGIGAAFAIAYDGANARLAPHVAYNRDADEFLVVWEYAYSATDHDVHAQRVASNGTLLGGALPVTTLSAFESAPRVAYNPSDGEYLVVWEARVGADEFAQHDIHARRLSAAGAPLGNPIVVDAGATDQRAPALAHGRFADQYLVVYQDRSALSGELDISARRVSGAGALVGERIAVATRSYDQRAPRVAFGHAADEFLVAWEDQYPGLGTDWDIYGQRVGADGGLVGGNLAIAADGSQDRLAPDVAYHLASGHYLLTWELEFSPTDHDVYRRRIAADGTPLEAESAVSNLGAQESRPALAAGGSGGVLAVWEDGRNAPAQALDVYGDLIPLPLPATPTATASNSPTRTATATRTPSASSTPTPTATASRTATPSPVSTATASRTPTRTATATGTATASAVSTATVTSSATASRTPTRTATATGTATASAVSTATVTSSATASRTPTRTAPATGTATASAVSTTTVTGSATASRTPTRTAPATGTATASAVSTATATSSATASRTSTVAPPPTATATPPHPTPTSSPTEEPSPPRLSAFGGLVTLGAAGRQRPLAGIRVELRGAEEPESEGELLVQATTDVDGRFVLSEPLAERVSYGVYNVILAHPGVTVSEVEPGTGGVVRSPTWVAFPPLDGGASLDTVWRILLPPPQIAVGRADPIPSQKLGPSFATIQPIDFRVDGVELTQAIQCFDIGAGDPACPDNSLPLVAGKLTAARVYISRVGPPPADPQYPKVRVDLFLIDTLSGLGVIKGASQQFTMPLAWNRLDAATTANFVIGAPAAGVLKAWAQVNADGKWPDPDASNNASAPTAASVMITRPAAVRWTRVDYRPDPSTKYPTMPFTGPALASEAWIAQQSLDTMRWVLPAATIDYRKLGTGVRSYGITLPVGGSLQTFTPDLRDDFTFQGKTRPAMSVFLDELILDVPSSRDFDTLLAWFPPEATAGEGPDGVAEGAPPIVPAGLGRACLAPEPKDRIGAHEVAHNFGLGHYPCALNPALQHPWPAPYNDCVPVEVPFNPFVMDVNLSFTFMTYGGDAVAPPEWNFLFDALQPDTGTTAADVAPEPVLLVSGWLTTDGVAALGPFYAVDAAPDPPAPGAEPIAALRLLDAADAVLATYPVTLPSVRPEAGALEAGAFHFALPRPDELARVELRVGDVVAAARHASATPPDGAWLSPPAGTPLAGDATLTWQASDADGDALAFLVSYSPDAGATWTALASDRSEPALVLDTTALPGGDACLVRVLVSDGWHTRELRGGPFRVARKPPQVAIGAPTDGERLAETRTRVFTGWASDAEDGALADDALRWSSDRDGELGSGPVLVVPALRLSPGAHVVTLTARDADGMAGEASVGVAVERVVDCPGDCDLDGGVAIDELIGLVRIALGEAPAFACPAGDVDGDGAIVVSELIAAVRRALEGCPAEGG